MANSIEVSNMNTDGFESILPEDIYCLNLKHIQEKPFTRREIDIIACILNGRTAKKTAAFLNLSPKTVENYIRNIMLKLGCNSQESILDFVEKSDKFAFIKKYYSSLLIQSIFKGELKAISSIKKNSINCLILIYENLDHNKYLINKLKEDFTILGINCSSITSEEYHTDYTPLNKKLNFDNYSFIIHCLSYDDFINNKIQKSDLIKPNSQLNLKKVNLESTNKNTSNIFLVFNENSESGSVINLMKRNHIFLSESKNYYLLFFEILKKATQENDITHYIKNFTKQYETLFGSPEVNTTDTNKKQDKLTNNDNSIKQNLKLRPIKSKTWVGGFVISFLSLFLFFYFYQNEYLNVFKNMKSYSKNSHFSNTNEPKHNPLSYQINKENPLLWNIPRQDNLFIGRKLLLKNLKEKLEPKNDPNIENNLINTVIINAVAGLGGVGKTQLALQYIHNSKFPYRLRAWFPSENLDELRQKYVEFSKELGLQGEASVKRSIEYVKNWLKENPGWLLVFDNVNSYQEIVPFLPEFGGSIIITTRSQEWPDKITVLPIDVMDTEDAIELVKALTGRYEPEMKNLVNILGYLPLSLSQASAYIKQNQITIQEYIARYFRYEKLMLNDDTMPLGSNHIPTAITWNATLKSIENEALKNGIPSIARIIITVCSYLDADNIPKYLLLSWFKKNYSHLAADELILDKVLGQLQRHSMIKMNHGTITIHRLVQTILRHQHLMNQKEISSSSFSTLTKEWYENLMEILHEEFIKESNIILDEKRKKELLPHLQTLIKHYDNYWPEHSNALNENKSSTLLNIVSDIGSMFMYTDPLVAKQYYERVLRLKTKYFANEPWRIADTLQDLAYTYRRLGDTNNEKILLERVLKINEQHYGKEHHQVAETLVLLADSYRHFGDPKHAEILLKKALAIQENHYGKNHIKLAKTLVSLGYVYRQKSEPHLVKELSLIALKIKKDHYGNEHWQLADALENLGNSYLQLGEFEKAYEALNKALKIQESYYGENHWRTAYPQAYLAMVHSELGNHQKAKTILENSLKIQESYYGPEHWRLANNLDNLGKVYLQLGELENAIKVLNKALKIKEQHYGKDHWPISITLFNMANVYHAQNKNSKAKELLEKALKIQIGFYGNEHWQVAVSLKELSEIYENLGSIKQANEAINQFLKIKTALLCNNKIEIPYALKDVNSITLKTPLQKNDLKKVISIERES